MMDLAVEKKELDPNNNASNYNTNKSNTDNPQEIPDSSSSFAYDGNYNPDKGAEERQTRDLKAGLHPLKHKFVFWYTRRTPVVRSQTSYEDNIKKIADFSTVEGWWVCYCHLARPSSLLSRTDLHLFKEGIRSLWEVDLKKPDIGVSFSDDWILRTAVEERGLNDSKRSCLVVFWEDLAVMGLSMRDSIKRHFKLPHSYIM